MVLRVGEVPFHWHFWATILDMCGKNSTFAGNIDKTR